MYLSHLSLTNFRNYRRLEADLPPGPVLFYGDNAQGKTNLLEAAYMLAIGKSFHASNEREVVNWEAASTDGYAMVSGIVHRKDGRLKVQVGFQCVPAGPQPAQAEQGQPTFSVRKQVRVNGIPRTFLDLVGLANAVMFSAEDMDLVLGAPALRRRYMDILISQVDPLYLKALQRYQRVLLQRNQLLKMIRDGRAKEGELEFWDQELVREGAFITLRRHDVAAALSGLVHQRYLELTGGREEVVLQYVPSVEADPEAAALERALSQALTLGRRREVVLGATGAGPHRDDLKMLVGGVDMGLYASRGQARTLALALRLAEASYLRELTGEEPVLLMDDLLSELDARRRAQVLGQSLAHQQALITATGLELFSGPFLRQATLFQVRAGALAEASISSAER